MKYTADDMRKQTQNVIEAKSEMHKERIIKDIENELGKYASSENGIIYTIPYNLENKLEYKRGMNLAKLELQDAGFKVSFLKSTSGDPREPLDCGQPAKLIVEW